MSRGRQSQRATRSADGAELPRVQAQPTRQGEDVDGRVLQAVTFNCAALADAELPQALGVTYWFEAEPAGDPYRATIQFAGRHVGAKSGEQQSSFSVKESLRVLPGSGRIAVTTRVYDLAPGEWRVTAAPVEPTRRRNRGRAARAAKERPTGLPRGSVSVTTAYAPVVRVRAPGARFGAWPALVGLGVAIGVTVQLLLAARAGLSPRGVLAVSLAGNLAGLIGAKLYYLALHREPLRRLAVAGMALQGYVLAAIASLLAGATIAQIPLGRLLDVTAPGLLLAMAIGRLGCFFGGCCVGRPTASRWGLWSSDRDAGMRRIPVQLLESGLAAATGVVALLAALLTAVQPAGVVFVGTLAAYTLIRQLLLPLRDLPRKTAAGRPLVMAATALVVAADVMIAALS